MTAQHCVLHNENRRSNEHRTLKHKVGEENETEQNGKKKKKTKPSSPSK